MPPKIDKTKCDGCGICIFECGVSVFGFNALEYRAYLIKEAVIDCVDCFICEDKCPRNAISIRIGKKK